MADKQQELINAYQKLMAVKGECTSKVCGLYSVAEMTVKQIKYLKIIDGCDNMTFSKLAEKTKITKPSVTDLINKLESFGQQNHEAGIIQNYLDLLVALPWKTDEINDIDINRAREILDEEHYGLKEVKDRII